MNKTKLLGQTFTEAREVLYMINMYGEDLLSSKILEPSFGDGQFLMKIISKIVQMGHQEAMSNEEIILTLNKNIYGYELDEHFFNLCIANLNSILSDLGFESFPAWDNLHNGSIFDLQENDFDLIIGNPPYVRVQNFDKGIHLVKEQLSRTNGNTDLFLMFIDFLLNKLNPSGELIFIVPNSLGKSKSAKSVRDFMFDNGQLIYIDFESQQLFAKASVYSCIFKFKFLGNRDESSFKYGYKGKWFPLKNNGYLSNKNMLKIKEELRIKNGIATLADSVFIREINNLADFKGIEKKYIFDLYKGSRMANRYKVLFPYELQNDSVKKFTDFKELSIKAPGLAKYLEKYKEKLESRSLEKRTPWFEYGRSQAIKDIAKKKIMIDTLIKPGQKALKTKELPKNSLVFSGLYTTTDKIDKINNARLISGFRPLAKDMRGGYKKISSSLLKCTK